MFLSVIIKKPALKFQLNLIKYLSFKETKRPSKEMQVTIARQLGLEPTTVGNFFMNARRRSMDKWKDEDPKSSGQLSPDGSHILDDDDGMDLDLGHDSDLDLMEQQHHQQQQHSHHHINHHHNHHHQQHLHDDEML